MFCNSDSCDSAIFRSPEPGSRLLVMEAFYFLYSPFPLFTGVRGSGILRSWLQMFSCSGCMVGKCLELDETTTDGGVDKVATTMMTKTYFEDLAKSAQESARIATEYWVSSREGNNKAAQEITRTLREGIKRQTKADEDLTSRVFEILEERDEAHKRFFQQWAEAFSSVPFEYTRQATREAQKKSASLR